MSILNNLLSKLSYGNIKEENEFELIGNCFGFYGMSSGVGTSTLISEIALLMGEKKIHTCIVDCNPLSTFYLTRVLKHLDDEEQKNIPSIANRFVKRSCDISSCLISVNNYLKVLTFGDTQYSDTFEIDVTVMKEIFAELKDVFDLVLLDIPHIPWSETVITALNACSTVYNMWSFSTENILKKIKTDNLYSLVGLDYKLNNVILMQNPRGVSLKSSLEQATKVNILLEIPYVSSIPRLGVSSIGILKDLGGKDAKEYAKGIDFIIKEITEGISDKHSE